MRWLQTHRVFSVTAAVLLVLLILLSLSWALRAQDNAVGSVARSLISIVQRPFAALGNLAESQRTRFTSGDDLIAENEVLKEKIDELEKQLIIQRLDREELQELRDLRESLSASGLETEYNLVAANVISFEGSDIFNIFTIDIGTESGVRRNSVVVAGAGLAGRVLSCGNGWARVVASIDENNNIGFQVHGEKDFLGVCYGDGHGMLRGELLDEDGVAEEDDIVVTAGNGGIYPSGIIIGKITKVELTGENPLLSVVIEPAVYFKGLKKVAVLV